MLYKDVISFSITEHLMKFITQRIQLILIVELLYDHNIPLIFVNSLTLYLHLASTKNLQDLTGTRELKTKSRVKLQ